MRQETATRYDDPAVDVLRSAREAKFEYKRLRLRVEELESRAERMTASMSGMPGGGGAGMEQLWATLADEREKMAAASEKELRRYGEAERLIKKLNDPVHRIILRLRYLSGMNWTQVHFRMHREGFCYTERHITRLHGEALKAVRRLWKEEHDEVHS